jgi:hypothetical protein
MNQKRKRRTNNMDKDIKDVGILASLLGMSVFGAVYFKQPDMILTGISIGATYLGVKGYITNNSTAVQSQAEESSDDEQIA